MNRPRINQPSDLRFVDGSLRDVYVFNTTIEDWETLIAFARAHKHEYTKDGVVAVLPNAKALLGDREHSHLLSVQAGNVSINCHFFILEEIELDIDPREIAGPEEHACVLRFIEQLAEATQKDVVITAENSPDAALLRYVHLRHVWHIYELGAHNDA
ncbi:hypothetical protein [Piscinibacter sp. HJYY11]|uniref:hypothetical protein n=1 Tax=Piscinibacter sp. HJYY11 TaxID=2801333 RepID=UPI00191DF7F4|nr:hypothetical protein [Piscinibacter sp. HJYY11]MBL0731206.1 hypothetical protein [Piscinibacter sp. HJYY11]